MMNELLENDFIKAIALQCWHSKNFSPDDAVQLLLNLGFDKESCRKSIIEIIDDTLIISELVTMDGVQYLNHVKNTMS
jgi:hypothetical protein